MAIESIKPVILIDKTKAGEAQDQSIYLQSLLAKIRNSDTEQPGFGRLINKVYSCMFGPMASHMLKRERVVVKTPIAKSDPKRGTWKGEVVARNQRVVIANVLRAGNEPSLHVRDLLLEIIDQKRVVMDFLSSERVNDLDGGIHSELNSSKADKGRVEGSVVLIPDPMGATGNSLAETIKYYVEHRGKPERFVTMSAMIAPRFLKTMQKTQNDIQCPVNVYAASLEKGLTKKFYIYPGGGDFGRRYNGTKK